jgi:hypothetical protein
MRLFRCASYIRKGEREGRSAPHVDGDPACSYSAGRPPAPAPWPAAPSTVTPHCSFPWSTTRAPLPAATSALRPGLPNSAGTAAPTRGNRSLGRQLATEAATQREALGPCAEALWPRLLLWLRRPDAEGRRRPHRDMMHAASVHLKCFRCFRGTLQVFHKDVRKVD